MAFDGDFARRLKACASIEWRKAEEVIAEALWEYFERGKLTARIWPQR